MIPAGTFKSIEQLNEALDTYGKIMINKDMVRLLVDYYADKFYVMSESKHNNLIEYIHIGFIIDYLCTQLESINEDVPETINSIRNKLNLRYNKENISVFVDGAARGNDNPDIPNKSAIAFAVVVEGKIIETQTKSVGDKSSTESEYLAIKTAVDYLARAKLNDKDITIYSDSEVVVNQINMIHRTKTKSLIAMRDDIIESLKSLNNVKVEFIPRYKNTLCDRIVNETLDSLVE